MSTAEKNISMRQTRERLRQFHRTGLAMLLIGALFLLTNCADPVPVEVQAVTPTHISEYMPSPSATAAIELPQGIPDSLPAQPTLTAEEIGRKKLEMIFSSSKGFEGFVDEMYRVGQFQQEALKWTGEELDSLALVADEEVMVMEPESVAMFVLDPTVEEWRVKVEGNPWMYLPLQVNVIALGDDAYAVVFDRLESRIEEGSPYGDEVDVMDNRKGSIVDDGSQSFTLLLVGAAYQDVTLSFMSDGGDVVVTSGLDSMTEARKY